MNWIHELKDIPKWKKYSQSGEEAYLDFILKNIPSRNKHIVELGAWDGYHLSNTRYFIEQGYSALLIDGDNHSNEEVVQVFIDKENIISTLVDHETPVYFDLLSIDLDGNDIYILEQILSLFVPSVIIAEFNPIHLPHESKTITYNPDHVWGNDDYYGFSFLAGKRLADKSGYTIIHQNDNLNIYMVENKLLAKSIGVPLCELGNHTPVVTYESVHYHKPSVKKQYVNYD